MKSNKMASRASNEQQKPKFTPPTPIFLIFSPVIWNIGENTISGLQSYIKSKNNISYTEFLEFCRLKMSQTLWSFNFLPKDLFKATNNFNSTINGHTEKTWIVSLKGSRVLFSADLESSPMTPLPIIRSAS